MHPYGRASRERTHNAILSSDVVQIGGRYGPDIVAGGYEICLVAGLDCLGHNIVGQFAQSRNLYSNTVAGLHP